MFFRKTDRRKFRIVGKNSTRLVGKREISGFIGKNFHSKKLSPHKPTLDVSRVRVPRPNDLDPSFATRYFLPSNIHRIRLHSFIFSTRTREDDVFLFLEKITLASLCIPQTILTSRFPSHDRPAVENERESPSDISSSLD